MSHGSSANAVRGHVRDSARGWFRGIDTDLAVIAAIGIVALAWVGAALNRESRFLDSRQDLGHFTQAVWSTAHGHFLQLTEAGGSNVSRLGIHVDPIIALFAPLWWLWPSPRLLLVVQAIVLATGALPLYWLGRKHLLSERDAALFAASYLLCPNIAWSAVSDFHAVCLAVPLLLFAIWYLDENRLLAFAAFAGAAVLCQEQIGLLVGCLGLWHVGRRRELRVGLAIAATGFAISAFDFLVVLRHFSGGSPFAARFGGSLTELASDLFTHPLRIANQINVYDLKGLVIAVPVLGACFGSSIMLAAAPQLALLLISRRSNDWLGINVLLVVPFVYAAALLATARARQRGRGLLPGGAWPIFVASLAAAGLIGPFGAFGVKTAFASRSTSVDVQRQAIRLVPSNARVSATNHLALPLSQRRRLYLFPVVADAEWIVVDSSDNKLPNVSFLRHRTGIRAASNELYSQPKLMHRELHKFEASTRWALIYREGNVYVFRRKGA
jgi:uncharacterized membrane protein